ncbi:MAG: hypothetical protein WD042_02575 [Phycisphaeraceae bacterium]
MIERKTDEKLVRQALKRSRVVAAPKITPSMRIALSDLKLDVLHVVYPGDQRYPLADKVQAIGLTEFVLADGK